MLETAGSWDRAQRTRTPSKRAYGYDPRELLASKPAAAGKPAAASSDGSGGGQPSPAGRADAAAAAREAQHATEGQGGGSARRAPHQQQQQLEQHGAGPSAADRGAPSPTTAEQRYIQQPFQQAPAVPPPLQLAPWQLEPPAQPARPPGGTRSVWQCPRPARKLRTGVRTLEVPVHVGFNIRGLTAALRRSKVHDATSDAGGSSSDATSSEEDLPALLRTGSQHPPALRPQSIHKKGQTCSLQKGATLMSTPCMTWWPAPGLDNGVMCSDCWTKFGTHCPHEPRCEACFLRLRGVKAAQRGVTTKQRGPPQPAVMPATAALATAPPLSRLMRGLKQLAAVKPPTKESLQVKELVAAYESEVAAMHRTNTVPAGAGWRASRPLLPPNFAPKPPRAHRHKPPAAAAAAAPSAAHPDSATQQPLGQPLQHVTVLQQAAALASELCALGRSKEVAGLCAEVMGNACTEAAAPAGRPPAWRSMAAKPQTAAQTGPQAAAGPPLGLGSAVLHHARSRPGSLAASRSVATASGTPAGAAPARPADSTSDYAAPDKRITRQQQKAVQPPESEQTAEQPQSSRQQPHTVDVHTEPSQQVAVAAAHTAAAAAAGDAHVRAPCSSKYRNLPGICQRSSKTLAAMQPATPDVSIQTLLNAGVVADGDILQYRVACRQGGSPVSPTASSAVDPAASGSLGSGSAGNGEGTARRKGHDPVLASAVVDASAGALRCRRCTAVVSLDQLQRRCAGVGAPVSPLAHVCTRGKRGVRRSLQELLAGLQKDEPSCASVPNAAAGKRGAVELQPSWGCPPTEAATLGAPSQPVCPTGAASGAGGGCSNGSGSVAGAPPPGTPDTVSPSRPADTAGARAGRKRSSGDLGGGAAAVPGSGSPLSAPPQQDTPLGGAAVAAKRRRRDATASASDIETLVVELSGSDPSSGGEASVPPDASAVPDSSSTGGPRRRRRTAAGGSPTPSGNPPAADTPLAPRAQAALAAWQAQQQVQQAAPQQPAARLTRGASAAAAAAADRVAQEPRLAPAAQAADEAIRRGQAAAEAWARCELAADERHLGTQSNPVSVASGPSERGSGGPKRSSGRHRTARETICLISTSSEDDSGDGASVDGSGNASPHGRSRTSGRSRAGDAGPGDSGARVNGGGGSNAAKPHVVTRGAAGMAGSNALGAVAGGSAAVAPGDVGADAAGVGAADVAGERPKKAPRRKESSCSQKRSLSPPNSTLLHHSKRPRVAAVA